MSTTAGTECPICNGFSSWTLGIRGWSIYKCPFCLSRFVYPMPSVKELAEVYDSFYKENAEQARRLYDANYGRLSFPRQWGIIKSLAKNSGRILDFGCGGGHFLGRAKSWERYGIEISEDARAVATKKGIKVFATLDDVVFPSEFFDVVVMFATIEHLRDPKGIVMQLSKLVKVGGLFVIMTGDVESWKAKSQGGKWNLYTPPGHTFFFSRYSIDYLMRISGYKRIKRLYTDGGEISLPFQPLNIVLRAGLEVYHRIPVLNTLALLDVYYGYYRRIV